MVWVWEEPGEGLQLNQLYNDTFDLEVNFWSIVKFTSTTTGSTGTSIGGTGGGGGDDDPTLPCIGLSPALNGGVQSDCTSPSIVTVVRRTHT